MEMRKTVLYGVLAFCLVVLNSCLGDPATQLTMANQAGVVVTGYGPGKAIYTKGDSGLFGRLPECQCGKRRMYFV